MSCKYVHNEVCAKNVVMHLYELIEIYPITYRYDEVIMKCWESNPEKRPQFRDLVPLLMKLLESNAGYTNVCDNVVSEENAATGNLVTVKAITEKIMETSFNEPMETSPTNVKHTIEVVDTINTVNS